jgi:hypothetical protein
VLDVEVGMCLSYVVLQLAVEGEAELTNWALKYGHFEPPTTSYKVEEKAGSMGTSASPRTVQALVGKTDLSEEETCGS